jgi:polar amino acid transport system permease protein
VFGQVHVQVLLRFLAHGALVTIELSASVIAASTVLAVVLTLLWLTRSRVVRALVTAYSWVTRGLPELVFLLTVYYGLAFGGVDIPAFTSVVIALTIASASYYYEIIRGGVQAVPRTQLESGTALGLSRRRIAVRIVTPQVVHIIRDSYVTRTTSIVKITPLASVVALPDVLSVANQYGAATNRIFLMYGLAALLFIAIISVLLGANALASRRYRNHGADHV